MDNTSLLDWRRILMGDAPWNFLLEVIGRGAVVYLVLLLFMRLLGRRIVAQMSISELAVILMLGACIGLPLQAPLQGLVPPLAVLVAVLICQRGSSAATSSSSMREMCICYCAMATCCPQRSRRHSYLKASCSARCGSRE
jgi:hypothetical protein